MARFSVAQCPTGGVYVVLEGPGQLRNTRGRSVFPREVRVDAGVSGGESLPLQRRCNLEPPADSRTCSVLPSPAPSPPSQESSVPGTWPVQPQLAGPRVVKNKKEKQRVGLLRESINSS